MAKIVTGLAAVMAGSVVLVGLAVPASAIDIGDRSKGLGVSIEVGSASDLDVDVGATVGSRSEGVNVDASAEVGGGDGLADVDAAASVGGAHGIDADAHVEIGGRDSLADVDATASVGGNRNHGMDADVDASIGDGGGADARVRVGIGDSGGEGRVVIGRPAPDMIDPRTPTTPPPSVPRPGMPTPGVNPVVPAAIANMSDDEVVRFQRRCRGILSDQAAYDRDLIALCRMLRTASR